MLNFLILTCELFNKVLLIISFNMVDKAIWNAFYVTYYYCKIFHIYLQLVYMCVYTHENALQHLILLYTYVYMYYIHTYTHFFKKRYTTGRNVDNFYKGVFQFLSVSLRKTQVF